MIPHPQYITENTGNIPLTKVFIDGGYHGIDQLIDPVKHLCERIFLHTQIELTYDSKSEEQQVPLVFKHNPGAKNESYELNISTESIVLSGSDNGLLYGAELLIQLLENIDGQWFLPTCIISDYPAFKWRGLMLDCSRHFLSKSFILNVIDFMPRLRFNCLHLHLNDDHGWRIEIEAFPRLTQIGANVETGNMQQGFYSKEDLREIVQYAQLRNIMVIPEIEIPGHSYAAVKSYPFLSCSGNPIRNPGHQKDLYCAGQEATFDFLTAVLDEIMEIFPAPYIHIGGDEAPKDRWMDCAHCQQRIVDEQLADEEELQAYMIRRISEHLQRFGRQIIGWEEILSGKPEQQTVVQWWRHRTHDDEGIRTAIELGHQVIASPNSFSYLSFPVHANEHFSEERTSNLEKVYNLPIIPQETTDEQRQLILGGECCVWTEYLTENDIYGMLFPRILAFAEVMWKNPEIRDFPVFNEKVKAQSRYWKSAGISYDCSL
jgi:hexosaminidase